MKAAIQLVDQVRAELRAGEIGSVDAYAECSGDIVTGAGGEMARQEALFRLGASSFADFVTVDLVTHTDVWLPYDLKGRHQQEIYTANGPRLAAVLSDLSEAAALAEVSATADTSAGRVALACEPRTVALAALRDRSRG